MDYKDKIRKLLALAKSPEPEEAKLALLKARKLMAEHKLSERDLEERNTTVIKRAISETFSKKANSWMDPLSIIIGENYYKQYLEWEKEDKDLALDRLRRCVQDALKEDLRVTDTDDRKGMLSTPGRGPSVYETAAVYSEIFRRARAGRAVAPLAVYSAAKYDETMTAARKRASVMLGL